MTKRKMIQMQLDMRDRQLHNRHTSPQMTDDEFIECCENWINMVPVLECHMGIEYFWCEFAGVQEYQHYQNMHTQFDNIEINGWN
jgi:hypothetical protein